MAQATNSPCYNCNGAEKLHGQLKHVGIHSYNEQNCNVFDSVNEC